MSWKICIATTSEASELIAEFLYELNAQGVSIQDPRDLQDLLTHKLATYWDYIDDNAVPQNGDVLVCGFFADKPTDDDLAGLADRLQFARTQMPVDMGTLHMAVTEDKNDGQWLENWKQFYHPICCGRVTVVPAWESYDGDGCTVRINPSIAFGSGEHESTRMCLQLLQTLPLQDKQVVDVGCGSGILGLAALKLGAKHAYMTDIDEAAVRNVQENARLNELQNYTVRQASLLDGCPVQADVMCANITADVLCMLAPTVAGVLKRGGYLIVSGIIADREQEVLDSMRRAGLTDVRALAENDWRAHLLQL